MAIRGCMTALLLLQAAACTDGPLLYVGRVVEDASVALPDAGPLDSKVESESGDDDEDVPCSAASQCEGLEQRPYCSEELALCVECLEDRHCEPDEHCEEDDGECEEDR